jgi:hypothetical protein
VIKSLKLEKIRDTPGGESFLRVKEVNLNIILKYIFRFLGIQPEIHTPDEA